MCAKPRNRNRIRGTKLGSNERDILNSLSGSDLLVGFLCSARSTKAMYRIARERAQARYRIRRAIDRLVEEGYILRRGDSLSLSKKGRSILGVATVALRKKIGTEKWDRKWRIISYDIPEHMRSVRNQIRSIVKRAGFVELQQSTWIYPHECAELSNIIKEDTRLTRRVLYGVLESIENDEWLKRIFKL